MKFSIIAIAATVSAKTVTVYKCCTKAPGPSDIFGGIYTITYTDENHKPCTTTVYPPSWEPSHPKKTGVVECHLDGYCTTTIVPPHGCLTTTIITCPPKKGPCYTGTVTNVPGPSYPNHTYTILPITTTKTTGVSEIPSISTIWPTNKTISEPSTTTPTLLPTFDDPTILPTYDDPSTTTPTLLPTFDDPSTTTPTLLPTFDDPSTTTPTLLPTYDDPSTTNPTLLPTFDDLSTTTSTLLPTFSSFPSPTLLPSYLTTSGSDGTMTILPITTLSTFDRVGGVWEWF